jgi:uncharacterized protein (TIGR00255 family)
MIRSMTGYGEASASIEAGELSVEVRTVNHRYFHPNLRLPDVLSAREPAIRGWLQEGLSRGHVACTIRIEWREEHRPDELRIRVDEARARAYRDALREMAAGLDLPGEVDLPMIARYNDVLVRETEDVEAPEIPEDALADAVRTAVARAASMREDEGRRLQDDLEGRARAMSGALDAIEERAPERLLRERDRLRAAIADLADGAGVDDDRIAQEIAYLAEKWDINEELVRFRSHLELFADLLASDAAEPVGKRLGFLVQEMHREANTIGSKANDAVIAHRVVAIKEEIERLREQVENVE